VAEGPYRIRDPDTVVTLELRLGAASSSGRRIWQRDRLGRDPAEPAASARYLWHISRDRRDATDVELTFVDCGDGTTCLEIVHSDERLGASGVAFREANTAGWARIPSFVTAER
jgi:hypothetical protein